MSTSEDLRFLSHSLAQMLRRSVAGESPSSMVVEAEGLIESAERLAAASDESFPLYLTICCLNCLADRVAPTAALEALAESLENHLGEEVWKAAGSHRLQGSRVDFGGGVSGTGTSLMRLETFSNHYAAFYGFSEFGKEDQEKIWQKAERGELTMPTQDAVLSGAHGIAWFTDREELEQHCSSSGAKSFDVNQAYDALGLDWTDRWEDYGDGPDGKGEAFSRALAVHCKLEHRQAAESELRVPTSLDGWGNFLFVPGAGEPAESWPEVPSRACHPATGKALLPEGVHGPVVVPEGSDAPIEACGIVSRPGEGDRIAECFREIADRALHRLRSVRNK
ncbi:MAG: hypothetical protein K0U98_07925 [Deltaproteobacteria bacterium]|nr:hypothetical protein [Deltaproteobacteria bacterium]